MLSLIFVWVTCLTSLISASIVASQGQLLIFDGTAKHEAGNRKSSGEQTISAEAARMIIASRLGVDAYHDLSSGTAEDYEVINAVAGGNGQQVFGESNTAKPVALVVLEGFAIKDASADHEIAIGQMPTTKATDTLLSDLIVQLMAKDGMTTVSEATINPTAMLHEGAIFRSSSASVRKLVGSKQHTDISNLITSLLDSDHDIVFLQTPAQSDSSSSASSYGTWTVPALSSSHDNKHDKYKRSAQFKEEEPLEPPHRSSSTSTKTSSSSGSHGTSPPDSDYDQSKPLRGILPSCFTTRSACESATRNCTGHGSCVLRYTTTHGGSGSGSSLAESQAEYGNGRACWSCLCRASVRTNSDGTKKTLQWGGPACQKKDIVAPFWLIAGFSVTLMSLVSWAVGNLYSMGEEPLPSVIGAGVSGPPRR